MMDNHQSYIEDILILRKEFDLVDKNNQQQLLYWFTKYEYLSTNDHAQIAGKSANYIRNLKRKAGIKHKVAVTAPISKSVKQVNTISMPADWDNPDWLSKAINIYSIKAIAAACGVSRKTILRRIKDYNLIRLSRPCSKNKCCTWDWCNLHYTEYGWSQAKCANKAGVCQQTFANWLNYFKIPVRNARETTKSHLNIKLWVRELYHKLEQLNIVNKIFLRSDHIHVRFKNYFWETYYIDHWPQGKKRPPFSYIISKEDAIINHIPMVLPEYEDGFDPIVDNEGLITQPHITINRNHLNKASFVEKRLAIHEYCRQITQRGWIWPEYPAEVLDKEWNRLINYDHNKYRIPQGYTVFASNGQKPAPGRRIIEHFFDLTEYSDIFRSPRLVMLMLNHLAKRKDLKFNTHNLYRIFSCGAVKLPGNHDRFKIYDPSVYAVIFKQLGIKGSILDITPGYGNRAIAAAINNLEYYTIPTKSFSNAIDKGFGRFCNLPYNPWNGQNVDLLLIDNNFSLPDVSNVAEYSKYAQRMMMFVPFEYMDNFKNNYNPRDIIQIKTKWFQKQNDYLFLW